MCFQNMPEDNEDFKNPTEEFLARISQKDSSLPSPIDLNIKLTKEAQLPSLVWTNAEQPPRLMKVSNSGHSIIVTAKWLGPNRPYITGGKLPGTYIFSQAHFHWGKNDKEGSEHTIEGTPQPLELHVVFFKTDYETPEKAMREIDGILVVAYFYNLRKQANVELSKIIGALANIVQPNTSAPIDLTPIARFAPIFTDDYFVYWGSVFCQTDFRIRWLICRQAQTVSADQLSQFRKMIGANKEPLSSNFRDPKSVNGRTILYVNPGQSRTTTLIEVPPDPPDPDTEEGSSSGKRKRRGSGSSGRKSRKSSVGRRKSRKSSAGRRRSSQRRKSNNDKKIHVATISYSTGQTSDTSVESEINRTKTKPRKRRTSDEAKFMKIFESLVNRNIVTKCDLLLSNLKISRDRWESRCAPVLEKLRSTIDSMTENADKDTAVSSDQSLNENMCAEYEKSFMVIGTDMKDSKEDMFESTVPDVKHFKEFENTAPDVIAADLAGCSDSVEIDVVYEDETVDINQDRLEEVEKPTAVVQAPNVILPRKPHVWELHLVHLTCDVEEGGKHSNSTKSPPKNPEQSSNIPLSSRCLAARQVRLRPLDPPAVTSKIQLGTQAPEYSSQHTNGVVDGQDLGNLTYYSKLPKPKLPTRSHLQQQNAFRQFRRRPTTKNHEKTCELKADSLPAGATDLAPVSHQSSAISTTRTVPENYSQRPVQDLSHNQGCSPVRQKPASNKPKWKY